MASTKQFKPNDIVLRKHSSALIYRIEYPSKHSSDVWRVRPLCDCYGNLQKGNLLYAADEDLLLATPARLRNIAHNWITLARMLAANQL